MKKRIVLIILMVLFAGLMIGAICYITAFRSTMNVYRQAEEELFFDVFPDAESRPLSRLYGLRIGSRENDDLFGYGKGDPTYSRLTAAEEKEVREILSDIRISFLRPDDLRYAEGSIGGFDYTIGFRKYTMNVYRAEGDICLRMTGETGTYRLACYVIENQEQGEKLLAALDEVNENHPESELWEDEEAFRKAVSPKRRLGNKLQEWNHDYGFSVVYVLEAVLAVGEALLLLFLLLSVRKERRRR